ncbi:MAG: IS200/IS605 family transposase [Candidatus Kapaibacterium sp.]
MSSYRQILYHIVFGTKERQKTITDEYSSELYKYIWGIVKNHDCHLYRINGAEEHIHLLCDLHPSISLENLIKDIKVASSLWLKKNPGFKGIKGWAEGYAAITISIKEKDIVVEYIKNQKEHHKKVNFFDEYKKFLIDNGIEFDEKYLIK